HRRRAGVISAALEDDLAAGLADDARHDRERHAGALEHRPLLDVQLEEGARQPAVLDAGGAAGTRPVLVAKGDDAERDVGTRGGLERGDDAERPVEATAVRDRVEVRAKPERRVAAPADRVARAVDLDVEPGLAQPACEELVRGVLLGRVADARRADRVQLLEPLQRPLHAAILPIATLPPP